MKLLQQLNEQASELDNVRELIAAIVQSAHFFRTRETEDQWLYRGMHESLHPQDGFVAIHQSRKDRKPKDSSVLLHKALDRNFMEDFGIPYRSEGLFVTGNPVEAKTYGKTAIILPEGKFQFCWGLQVSDAYARFDLTKAFTYVRDEASTMGEDLDKYPPMTNMSDFIEFVETHEWARQLFDQWVDWYYEQSQYSNKNLPDAIESYHEIMIHCNEYAVIKDKESIRDYYINAAEHLLGADLGFKESPNMKQFINAIAKKVVH